MLLREVEILLGNLAGCNILFISIYSLLLAEEVMAVVGKSGFWQGHFRTFRLVTEEPDQFLLS